MDPLDQTFSEISLYGTTKWAAQRIGLSKDTFFRKRHTLEQEGFPLRDPITNLFVKADVDAWVETRRRKSSKIEAHANSEIEGIRTNGL